VKIIIIIITCAIHLFILEHRLFEQRIKQIGNVDLQNNLVKVEVKGTPIAMDHNIATSFGSNSKLVMKKCCEIEGPMCG
jgi:hypothetical protein